MIEAKQPINEKERIRELKSFNILDTLPEIDYDNLTSLAAHICDSNMSLVSLVDSERQWFKSSYGLKATETPRSSSFCAHAINEINDIFIIEDARKDIRFADNPLVVNDPFVIFYAGVPLITSKGLAIGTLCVIDKEPKKLNSSQIIALKSLANQVTNLLELRKNKQLLEQVLTDLEQRNNRLEEFTYIASHDLQEPLRTIQNLIGYIDNNYNSVLDSKGKKSIEYILQASENMSSLIKALLVHSRLGNHSKLEQIDTNKLVNSVLESIHILVQETNASIQINDLPQLNGHELELRLLFQNLLTNAIKFRKKNMSPEIIVTSKKYKNDWQFAIKDNGIGIDKKYRNKVFKIFQKLHLQSEYKGTGIGLTHCKKIVEIHGGKIWFNSQINEGCTFYFTIPQSST